MNYKLWYAVQRDNEDDWGTGSYNLKFAIEKLKYQGSGLIAVIYDGVCIDEIKYDDIID